MGGRHNSSYTDLMSVASDRRILTLLVRARMSLRRQRRDSSFYHRLAKTGRNPRADLEDELSRLFPPRREWPRPGLEVRRRAGERGLDPMSASLIDWLLRNYSKPKGECPDWLRRLRRLIGSVRCRIRDWDIDSLFESPKIYALPKSHATETGGIDTFRCVATYSLSDRLVISIVARYLRETTDSKMYGGSLAFRTQIPPPTHHDAVERILQFRNDNRDVRLWISEVDIRGFFDVVSHTAARRTVAGLVASVRKSRQVDQRALWMLDAYLKSYSFNKYGRPEAELKARRYLRRGYGVDVPWPAAHLRALGVDTDTDLVGIPQGGALSCFLANAILNQADWAVDDALSVGNGNMEDALYLRYCDDIICLARSQRACRRMVDAYQASLVELKLPVHDMFELRRRYDGPRERRPGGFWNGKSKAPYEWGPADARGRVPWCAFVGYHIRYDGVLRIRPSSIKKEIKKHYSILRQVRGFLRQQGQTLSKKQIMYRCRQRLRCIAVGSGVVGDGSEPPAFSWTQGFRLLRKYPSLTGQLRDLDRHRVACLRQLGGKLRRRGKAAGATRPRGALAFEGFPFSYAGLAERGRLGRALPSAYGVALGGNRGDEVGAEKMAREGAGSRGDGESGDAGGPIKGWWDCGRGVSEIWRARYRNVVRRASCMVVGGAVSIMVICFVILYWWL